MFFFKHNVNNMTDRYNIIEEKINNLNYINIKIENLYSNIVFEYNAIKDNIYVEISNSNIDEIINNIEEVPNNIELRTVVNNYKNELITNINLVKINTDDIRNNILEFDNEINMKLLLNSFIKEFNNISYSAKLEKILLIQLEYLKYLKSINKNNKALIVSHLHPIYITPLLLLDNRQEIIKLKDNVIDIRQIKSYYGIIAPDIIQFNVKLLTSNIRNNLIQQSKPLFEKTYNGALYFYPDYRNKTYEIEIEAYCMLLSKVKYKFIIIENGFPTIEPNIFNSNIKLGNINNNTFNLNLRDYYTNSNILFMIETNNNTTSNLTYDDIYTYTTTYVDYCNIPIITDNIIITPYFKNYPILCDEYSNIPVILNVISSPEQTIDTFKINLTDRTPYTYDLTQIKEWYINISHESSISFGIINTRSNIKNPELPIIVKDPISNILYIYPDYRGETYNITVNIETLNDYAIKNIIELEITENDIPKPIRNTKQLLLEHLLIKEDLVFDANNYFISTTTEKLNFNYNVSNIFDHVSNISLDILPYNVFEITRSNLRFKPDYRNISYELHIYAIDSIYNVNSDNVLMLNIREDKILNKKNELYNLFGIGNDIMEINIYDHIKLPIDRESMYIQGLRYTVSVNKDLRKNKKTESNAVYISSDGMLYIDPDFRNDNYTVNVLVEAYDESVKVDNTTFTFSVYEVIAPYPLITNNNVLIQTTNYNKNTKTLYINELTTLQIDIDLNLFFINTYDNNNKYNTISTLQDDIHYFNIIDNILRITPNVRNVIKHFSISATDNIYNTCNIHESNLLNIELTELSPIMLKVDINNIEYELTDNSISINLDTIFSSRVIDNILEYDVSVVSDNDIRSNVFSSLSSYDLQTNLLILYPDYRGINYTLNVQAINTNYITQPLYYYINIIEAEKLNIVPKISTFIEINIAYFDYNDNDIIIDCKNLFVHYKYYSNYEIKIREPIGIVNIEDVISLDDNLNLVISKFILSYNFTLSLFLFDLIENQIVDNNEIIINFIYNVITLSFNSIKIVDLEEITDNYRYDIIGLNDNIINVTLDELSRTEMTIQKDTLDEYEFVVNKVHIELNLIVKQLFYKVVNNLV